MLNGRSLPIRLTDLVRDKGLDSNDGTSDGIVGGVVEGDVVSFGDIGCCLIEEGLGNKLYETVPLWLTSVESRWYDELRLRVLIVVEHGEVGVFGSFNVLR
jgi:hypothetical protein